MLSSTDRYLAWLELQSLKVYAGHRYPDNTEKQYLDTWWSIYVPAHIHTNLTAFCEAFPSEARAVHHALAFREYMLHLLESGLCPRTC